MERTSLDEQFLWNGGGKRLIALAVREKLLRVMDRLISLIVVMVSWCIHISKLIKLCTLNLCTLGYFN